MRSTTAAHMPRSRVTPSIPVSLVVIEIGAAAETLGDVTFAFSAGRFGTTAGAGFGSVARSIVDGAVAGRISIRSGDHAASAGTIINVPSVTSQTRRLAPAEARCIAIVTPSAAMRISVAFARRSSIGVFQPGSAAMSATSVGIIVLSPALTSAADCFAQPLHLGVLDVHVGHSQECGDRLLRGARKVCSDDVRQHVLTGLLGRFGRIVDVARPVFL